MGFFRRHPRQPERPAAEAVPTGAVEPPAALVELVERLAMPCARIEPGSGPPASATASYVAGHPYSPDDRPWPTWEGAPMFFLAQVAFADLPPLDGFPRHGLLQWFVGADDTLGLTFDETAGTVGFEVRWYDDLTRPSLASPSDPTPWHRADAAGEEVHAAIDITEATALAITPGRMLPTWEEAAGQVDDHLVVTWGSMLGADETSPDHLWDTCVRGEEGPFPDLGAQSNIGGSTDAVQEDPRGWGTYAAPGTPAGRLLVQLDAHQFGGWGDLGIGHLFGDAEAVGRGDLSSLRYHWDCS